MPYSPSIMVMLKVAGTTDSEPVHSTTNSSRSSTTSSSNTVNYRTQRMNARCCVAHNIKEQNNILREPRKYEHC